MCQIPSEGKPFFEHKLVISSEEPWGHVPGIDQDGDHAQGNSDNKGNFVLTVATKKALNLVLVLFLHLGSVITLKPGHEVDLRGFQLDVKHEVEKGR